MNNYSFSPLSDDSRLLNLVRQSPARRPVPAKGTVTVEAPENSKEQYTYDVSDGGGIGTTGPGIRLQPKARQYSSDILLLVLTAFCIIATVTCAFLCSSSQPPSWLLNPTTTVLLITIGSGVSAFFLGQLSAASLNRLRWALAASPGGIEFATFLGLSKATEFLGLAMLTYTHRSFAHRLWCSQRVLSIFLRLIVGVLLLSSIRIEPFYLQLGEPEPVIAGLDQFNASLASTAVKDTGFLPLWFTMRISSLLSDPGNAIMLPTTATQDAQCASGRCDCAAYILPGELDSIPLDRPPQSDVRWDATSFEVELAPAYQLEFKSVPTFSFDDTDCQLYGVQKSFSNSRPLLLNLTTISKAFKLCLKNIDGDLFADAPVWGKKLTYATQLHINSMLGSTLYSLTNSSIQSFSVANSSSVLPVDYRAADIFKVLSLALNPLTPDNNSRSGIAITLDNAQRRHRRSDIGGFGGQMSVGADIVGQAIGNVSEALSTMLALQINKSSGQGPPSLLECQLLQNLLALPLYTFNARTMQLEASPDSTATLGRYIKTIWRIVIAKHCLSLFTALSSIMLLWCAGILVYSWIQGGCPPNVSSFAEIDFATKYVAGIPTALPGMGNASTRDLCGQIQGRLFLGASKTNHEVPEIAFSREEDVDVLVPGLRYR